MASRVGRTLALESLDMRNAKVPFAKRLGAGCLGALLLSWALMAPAASPDSVPAEEVEAVQDPRAGMDDEQSSQAGQQPALSKQRKLEERNKDVFKPSEDISEDFAAPMPTDI